MIWEITFILSGLWFIALLKKLLFWLYLWQLRNYHTKRFFTYFYTSRGKKAFFNFKFVLKIALLFALIAQATLIQNPIYNLLSLGAIVILLLLYGFDTVKFLREILIGRLKKPTLTLKTTLLILIGAVIELSFSAWVLLVSPNTIVTTTLLLGFDILLPLIVTAIVFIFKPLVLLEKRRIIWKATRKREKFKDLFVIGITGSYGRKATKEILSEILSRKFNVLKTKENQNSEMGVSNCILDELNENHDVFICEMNTYNKGGIKLLCDIAKPNIGILTGIDEQNLTTFGTLENIIETRFELIESLPEMGFAVFNGDDQYCRGLYKRTQTSKRICYTKFFASAPEVVTGDYWIKNLEVGKKSISFRVFSRRWGGIGKIKANLLGEHHAQNILMASVVAKEILGMTIEEINRSCQEIEPERVGMKFYERDDGINIIDSTYSANPNGVIAHLDYLSEWDTKKVLVMPCLIELGEASERVHKNIGAKIGKVCDLAIITTEDCFKIIKGEAVENGLGPSKILFMKNPNRIYKRIKELCKKGDVVLLEKGIPRKLVEKLKS